MYFYCIYENNLQKEEVNKKGKKTEPEEHNTPPEKKAAEKRGIQVENMSNIYYEVDDDKRSPMDLLRSHGRAVAR